MFSLLDGMCEGFEFVQLFQCFSRIDGILGQGDPLFDGRRFLDGIQRTARVQEDNVPARAGHVNGETQFVLNYFGLEEPKLVEDVRTR